MPNRRRARPRLLFAWELGTNFGHIGKIAGVARAIGGRAEMVFAARDPVAVRQLMPEAPVTLLAAPCARPAAGQARPADPARSYADELRHVGWADSVTLGALVESWDALIRLVDPDVVVAQAAPTALLATWGTGRKTAMLGSGYDAPPRSMPMPAFQFWTAAAGRGLEEREAAILATANAVLSTLGRPAVARFRDLIATDYYGLAALPQVDHYAPRTRFEPDHPPHLDQITERQTGAAVDWLPGSRRRVFAYLRPGLPGFAETLPAVLSLGPDVDAVFAAPGADAGIAERCQGSNIRLIAGPVRLDRLLGEGCDLGITHGSNGTVAVLVRAGVPQLGLPGHIEQVMATRTMAAQGLGSGLVGGYGKAEVGRAVTDLLASDTIRETARMTGDTVRATFRTDPAQRIADGIIALFD